MPSREALLKALLWYNVLSLSIWVGGTLYQMLVIVPIWSAAPPESLRAFLQGTTFLATIPRFFGPVTQLLRALPLAALVGVAWKYSAIRPSIAACAATMLVGLVMTRAFIYPMNDVLFWGAREGVSPDALRALVTRWIWWDRVRFAIMTGGYLCLLHAFSQASRALLSDGKNL
jgi:hypothetical protein